MYILIHFTKNKKQKRMNPYLQIQKYTVQLFEADVDNIPCILKPLGSGVFCSIGNRYFLLSAGHVFTNINIETIGVYVPDSTFYNLKGTLHYMRTDDPYETSNTKADIAVFEIDKKTYSDIASFYEFASIDTLLIDYYPGEAARCILMGYPSSKFKNRFKHRTQTSKIWGFESAFICDTSVFEQLNKDIHTNYLIEYHIRKLHSPTNGGRIMGARPEGMSGCGVWAIINDNPKLIAIMNGYDRQRFVIIATKIDFYTELIRQRLGLDIVKSNREIEYR